MAALCRAVRTTALSADAPLRPGCYADRGRSLAMRPSRCGHGSCLIRSSWLPKTREAAAEALKDGRQVGLPPYTTALLNLQLTARCISLAWLPSLNFITSLTTFDSRKYLVSCPLPPQHTRYISSHCLTQYIYATRAFSHDPLTPELAVLMPTGFTLATYRRAIPHDKGDNESSAATGDNPWWSNASPTRSHNRRRTPATKVLVMSST